MEKLKQKEKVILGIDPGTQILGYGIIKVVGKETSLVQYGVINLTKFDNQAIKLQKIYQRMSQLIKEFLPDEVALEAPFFGKNVQSMLKLGRAQGVAMAAALNHNIPISEYAPKSVKQAVTGNGNASKEQVAAMLMNLLNFNAQQNELLDATDALAVALCHHYHQGNSKRRSKSWNAFALENPGRIR